MFSSRTGLELREVASIREETTHPLELDGKTLATSLPIAQKSRLLTQSSKDSSSMERDSVASVEAIITLKLPGSTPRLASAPMVLLHALKRQVLRTLSATHQQLTRPPAQSLRSRSSTRLVLMGLTVPSINLKTVAWLSLRLERSSSFTAGLPMHNQ